MQQTAVTQVQARWRGHKQRRAFLQVRAHMVLLQAAARRAIARRAYLQTLTAVVVLQSGWRARQSRLLLKSIKVRVTSP